MGDGRGGERPTPKQQWTKDVQSLAKLLLEETTILDLVLGAKVYGWWWTSLLRGSDRPDVKKPALQIMGRGGLNCTMCVCASVRLYEMGAPKTNLVRALKVNLTIAPTLTTTIISTSSKIKRPSLTMHTCSSFWASPLKWGSAAWSGVYKWRWRVQFVDRLGGGWVRCIPK